MALLCAGTIAPRIAPAQVQEPEEEPVYEAETTAPAPPTTASEVRLEAEVLGLTPHGTAEDYLRLVPGLLIVQHGNEGKGHQFFVRGFDAVHGSDVEGRLEGIPLNEPSQIHANGYLDLVFLIPEVVLELEATKGAFRLDQGNFATAATVDWRLGVPRDRRGTSVTYEVGSTNRHRGVVVLAPEAWPDDAFVAAEALHDDGYGQNREVLRGSAIAQGVLWRPSRHSRLDALALGYHGEFGLPGAVRLDDWEAGEIGFLDAYVQDTSGASSRALGSLHFRSDLGDGRLDVRGWGQWRRLELDENFTGFLGDAAASDRQRQRQTAGSGGIVANLRYPLAPRLSGLLHALWQIDAADQRADALDLTGTAIATERDLDLVQHHVALAPGVRWVATDWLDLEGGARVDFFAFNVDDAVADLAPPTDTAVQVSPRLAATAYAGTDWTVFAGFGRGLRSPEARSLTAPPPDRDVDTEQYAGGVSDVTASTNVEVGARYTPTDWLDAGVAGFGIWIDREAVFDHISNTNLELDGTQRLGVEADVRVAAADWLDITADAALVDGRFNVSGNPIPGAPPFLANLRLLLHHPAGARGSAHLSYLSPRPLAHGAEAGAVALVDLTAGWDFSWLAIQASVENLLDTDWREGEYHFASWWALDEAPSQLPVIHYTAGPPRTFGLSLTGRF